ncbi:ATP-binding cassette sub-family G member 4 [Chrysoperla carnea]|uniref:ATP-binding cassette sub-family G member 4 n=1 Tax=Chrysoperla carnea TaxID=189513 RepID=UPI001D05FB69|nr:ATP-binding cassette sub-family G member 4 [Chrysoperla carnea]
MDVQFYDLSYIVRQHGRNSGTQTILKSVNGRFQSGHLSAIMGPSGAGKSSLLNAVSGYRSVGVKGIFKINDQLRDENTFHKSSCYITQEDLLQPFLSVDEVMTFASNLKLSTDISAEKKQTIVDTILTDLGLYDHKLTSTECLSGGQKKRLSIALELVNNPPIFFLDEPTSGLDDVSTKYCIKLLHKLSRQGRTIVCTIHQPSATLFEMFDHVYVLSRGQCVYQGATNALVSFLSSSGLECPKHYNPADFIIEVTDGDNLDNIKMLSDKIGNGKLCKYAAIEIDKMTNRIQNYQQNDATQNENDNNMRTITKYTKTKSISKVYESTTLPLTHACDFERLSTYMEYEFNYSTNKFHQFIVILQRMLKQIFRNTTGLKVQFTHYLMCGLMIGTMFYNNANDGAQMFNHLKFCVGVILFFAYTQLMIPVLVFPTEVKLVKKEIFNRWYSLTPYYAALTVSKIPVQLTLNMMFLAMVYFMSGLPNEWFRFTLFALIGNLTSFIAEGIGLAIGSIFNITNGCAVGPGVVAPFLGLAVYGFDFAKEIPWFLYAVMKVSFMRCGVVALVLTVFGYDRPVLDCNDVYCLFDHPEKLLNFLDISNSSVWSELAAMVGILLFFRTICYVSLRWRFVR